jgi:hemolysin III
MSVEEISLPNYTIKQDIWNAITHGLGAIFGIVATVLMLLKINLWGAVGINHTEFIYRIIGVCIYGAGMIICYTISCVYHSLFKNNGKKVLRVIDHDTVYMLIAGSYTVFCLTVLREQTMWGIVPYIGWIIFGICWIGVIIGIVFNSINIHKFMILSTSLYITIGWSIIFASQELINTIGVNGFLWMLCGGIAYTVGAVLYGVAGKKSLWFHTVFHIFILIGTVLQFISVWFYVLN